TKIFLHSFAQFHKERLLLTDEITRAHRAMPRANGLRSELFCALQGFDPFSSVPVGRIIIRAIDAGIAGEENFFLREPREAVTMSVRHAEMEQFDPVFA